MLLGNLFIRSSCLLVGLNHTTVVAGRGWDTPSNRWRLFSAEDWSLVVASGPVQAATPPLSLCRIHPVSRRPFLDVVRWCPVMSVTLNLAPMSLVVLIGKCRSLTASSEQGWCCLERTKRKKIWKNSLHGPRNNNTSFHDPQKLNLPYLALILTSIPSMALLSKSVS